MKAYIISLCLLLPFLATGASAQESPWQVSNVPQFEMRDVAVAKIYKNANGKNVLGLLTFKPEVKTTPVERTRIEYRTRTVTDAKSGKTREENYEVTVPYMVQMTTVSYSRTRWEVPLESTKIWDFNGELQDVESVQQLLASPARCFVMTKPHQRRFKDPIDDFYASMFKDNVLVIWYDPENAKSMDGAAN